MTTESRRVTLVACAGSLLPTLLLVAALVLVGGRVSGWDPIWTRQDINMSEQAALKDRAGIRAALERGEDPNIPRVVRPDLIKDYPVTVTPLEAAIATRETWLVQFMIDSGALVTDENRERLVCVAREVEAAAVEEMLAAGKAVDCSGVTTPWR